MHPLLFAALAIQRIYTYIADEAHAMRRLHASLRVSRARRPAVAGEICAQLGAAARGHRRLHRHAARLTVTPDSHAYIGYVLALLGLGAGISRPKACRWLVAELQGTASSSPRSWRRSIRATRDRCASSSALVSAAPAPNRPRLRGKATTDFRYRLGCGHGAWRRQCCPELPV